MKDIIETLDLPDKDGFNIRLNALDEDHPINEDLIDESILDETIKDVESGKLIYFCAQIVVSKCGVELGTEYLGCCFEKHIREFKKSGYLEQMIEAAMEEAKETINCLTK